MVSDRLSSLDRRQSVEAAVSLFLLIFAAVTALTQDGLFPLVASALVAGYALSSLYRLLGSGS
jgi:uncharacterized membrane protein